LNWVKLQRDASPEDQLIYSIVGLHALTLPQNPETLSAARMDMFAALLAVGINPDRSIVFHQERVCNPQWYKGLNLTTNSESKPRRVSMDIELPYFYGKIA
jgi:tryptophanyl-tRNA synthetase